MSFTATTECILFLRAQGFDTIPANTNSGTASIGLGSECGRSVEPLNGCFDDVPCSPYKRHPDKSKAQKESLVPLDDKARMVYAGGTLILGCSLYLYVSLYSGVYILFENLTNLL